MNYYSTNDKSARINFKDATILGQAPDRGLYFPERIPRVEKSLLDNIESLSDQEIAFHVIRPYAGDSINESDLQKIVDETINFPIPVVHVHDSIYTLELFHGPTLAFKDIGARFMSRCLGHFSKETSQKVTVLVATSGDTGGAVANGFYDVPGVEVVILYPSGKVSSVQEKQLTTLGKNIKALEVEGTFDDCQQMVKQAFMDEELKAKMFLTSANSINVARWLPQQFYYFLAWKQWKLKDNPPVICVPSGNFGNICAGLLAQKSGLPIKHFIAATNANDIVTRYLESGIYQSRKAVATLSNAMDVGDPSNFVRIFELFQREYGIVKGALSSGSVSDEETVQTIEKVKRSYNYLLDPHGAVGYAVLKKYLDVHPADKGIFLETAHPVKFYDVVEPVIKEKIPLPASVQSIINKKKESVLMPAEFGELKNFLLKN